MTRRLSTIGLIIAFLCIVLFTANSWKSHWNHRSGNFVRMVRPHLAQPIDTIQFPGSCSILSADYLSAEDSVLILQSGNQLYRARHQDRTLRQIARASWPPSFSPRTFGKSVYVGGAGGIDLLDLTNTMQPAHLDLEGNLLTSFVPIDGRQVAVCVISPKSRRSLLGITSATGRLKLSDRYPEPGTDSIFSVDGMLSYSRRLHRIIYVHYYKNEILHLDTALRLVSRSQTIDTFRTVAMKVSEIGGRMVMANPPPTVNKSIFVSDVTLFVHSNVRARNENASQLADHAPIDVYDLRDGRYLYSFYLPHVHGIPLAQFVVADSILYSVHGNQVVRYRLW